MQDKGKKAPKKRQEIRWIDVVKIANIKWNSRSVEWKANVFCVLMKWKESTLTSEPISETRRSWCISTRARMQRNSSSSISRRKIFDGRKTTHTRWDEWRGEERRWRKRMKMRREEKNSYVVCNIHSSGIWYLWLCRPRVFNARMVYFRNQTDFYYKNCE